MLTTKTPHVKLPLASSLGVYVPYCFTISINLKMFPGFKWKLVLWELDLQFEQLTIKKEPLWDEPKKESTKHEFHINTICYW